MEPKIMEPKIAPPLKNLLCGPYNIHNIIQQTGYENTQTYQIEVVISI